jgi:uncharacterized membrane protein
MNKFTKALLLLALTGVACGGEENSAPNVDCMAAPVPSFAAVSAFQTCVQCHSSTRTGAARQSAPAGINFDTYAEAAMNPELTAHEVDEGAMPPPASGLTLTATEKDELLRWALCGTPM